MKLSEVIQTIWKGTSPGARRARQLIKLAVLVILFIAIFWVVPIGDVVESLLNADPLYLLLGFALAFPVGYLRAVQMKLLIRHLDLDLSVLQIFAINLTIKFYMLFLPNALVGSGMRWYKFSQPGGKSSEALAAVAFNRLMETFLVFVVGLGFWLLSGVDKIRTGAFWLVLLTLATMAVWFVLIRISRPFYKWFIRRDFYKGENSLFRWFISKTEELLLAVSTYREFSAWELIAVILVGTARLLLGALSFLYLGMAVGITLSYIDMGWIQSVVAVTSMLPLSIGEGFGYREISLVAILGTFGITPDVALAFSFIIFGRSILQGIVGGIIEAIQTLQVRGQAG